MEIAISIGTEQDLHFANVLADLYKESAAKRGIGIAIRSKDYIAQKILSGHSILAKKGKQIVGFCYIEQFENKNYVSNSGLIVVPEFRNKSIARRVKKKAFDLARSKYPDAKIFGITTSEAVMNINTELGYKPAPLYRITQDEIFWNGCKSCKYYPILAQNEKKMCLCTGMIAPSYNESLKQSEKEENEK